jgi:hypothetical protein
MIVKTTRHFVHEAVQDGEMDEVWKAIRKELNCDITVEYVGGPVQIRFGDYISESFKRVPLSKVIKELVSGIYDKDGEYEYYIEIADALIRSGNKIRKAVQRVDKKRNLHCPF